MPQTPPLASLLYAAAYLLGGGLFWSLARKRRMDTRTVFHVMLAGVLGGLLGANFGQLLAGGGAPGKSILGAGLGGWLAVELYKRVVGLRRSTGDLFAVAVAGGEAVGRWGCFTAGCCYGRECHLPWAVFQHGVWRHPTQLYLSLWSAAVLVVLLVSLKRGWPEGALFWLQGVLGAAGRFGIEFLREGHRGALGLSSAQWVCLGLVLVFGIGGLRMLVIVRRWVPEERDAGGTSGELHQMRQAD